MQKKKGATDREHHRRARSLEGTEKPSNISYVSDLDHKAWHILVGNMNAYQIRDFLNYLEPQYKPIDKKVICRFINGTRVVLKGEKNSHNKNKLSRAWERLFRGLSFEETIDYINSTWLDPSYHFYIRRIIEK